MMHPGDWRSAVAGQFAKFGWVTILGTCIVNSGCGSDGPIVVYGEVVCAGQPVERGDVTFIPIGTTKSAGGGSEIVDGSYRIDGRDGLPPGEYRVVVNALEKTGRKVTKSNGFEPAQVDETRRMGPEKYATSDSPLLITIRDSSSNPVDIELPME